MVSILKAFTKSKPSKHQKLAEEWGDSIKQPVNEGITFYCKYLGSTLVDEPSNETVTAEAIKCIINIAKASGKKLMRVALVVKPTGLITREMTTNEDHLNVSIYRISYCSADATFDRVVAFIATNKNETLECHAFLTPKRKIAQAAALTISQAFNIAFEKWLQLKQDQEKRGAKQKENGKQEIENGHSQENRQTNCMNPAALPPTEAPLIDLSADEAPSNLNHNPMPVLDFLETPQQQKSNVDYSWADFDDDFPPK